MAAPCLSQSGGDDLGTPCEEIVRRAAQVVQDGRLATRVGQAMAQRYRRWPATEVVEGFEDDRLRELGRRLVFYEAPDALDPDRRRMLEAWLQNRRHGRDDVKAGRTISEALGEVETLDGDADAIDAIGDWLATLASH